MHTNQIEEIRSLPLLKDVSDASFKALTRGAYIQNFPPHTELITEGEQADFLYVVLSGTVELVASWNGNETTLATVWPISSFVMAATITGQVHLKSGRTVVKSRLVLIPSEDVRAVFETDPVFAKAVVYDLATYYRASVRNTKNLKLRTSTQRLANYLLKCQNRKNGIEKFELPYEKRRLASYLGMTPENLSRSFKALCEYDVEITGQLVHINNKEKLMDYAKPTDLIDGY